jgi:hypothetical protein
MVAAICRLMQDISTINDHIKSASLLCIFELTRDVVNLHPEIMFGLFAPGVSAIAELSMLGLDVISKEIGRRQLISVKMVKRFAPGPPSGSSEEDWMVHQS